MLRPPHFLAKPGVIKYNSPKKFGDKCTGDHLVTRKEEEEAFDGSKHALVLNDLFTDWIDVHAQMMKDFVSCLKESKNIQLKQLVIK